MTQRAYRPCRRPGCPGVTNAKSGYCDEHTGYGKEQTIIRKQHIKKTRTYKTEKTKDSRHHTHRWTKKSKSHRKRHPLCEDCKIIGIIKQADMVDHVDELKDGGALLDDNNLRSLCWSCHARKTATLKRAREGASANF